MKVLGRWLQGQCNNPKAAIPRLGRRLKKIDGGSSWDLLQEVLTALAGDNLSNIQIEAIDDLHLAFRK